MSATSESRSSRSNPRLASASAQCLGSLDASSSAVISRSLLRGHPRLEQRYPVPCASAGDGDDRVGAVEGEADLSNGAELLIRHTRGHEVDSRDGRGTEP